jgi:hypothetical protein
MLVDIYISIVKGNNDRVPHWLAGLAVPVEDFR